MSGQTSYLYNSDGQLLVDTSLRITKDQVKTWQIVERKIVGTIASHIEFSQMAREAGITGILIAAFEYDSGGLKNIRIVKRLGGGLDESVLNGLEKTKTWIDREFRTTLIRADMMDVGIDGTYFIPFDFSLIDVNEKLKERHSIPIIQSKVILIN